MIRNLLSSSSSVSVMYGMSLRHPILGKLPPISQLNVLPSRFHNVLQVEVAVIAVSHQENNQIPNGIHFLHFQIAIVPDLLQSLETSMCQFSKFFHDAKQVIIVRAFREVMVNPFS